MANPYQFWNHQLEQHYDAVMAPYTPRKTSAASSTRSTASPSPVQTRSDGCPFSAGVVFDRRSGSTSSAPSSNLDDELVYVVVKVSPTIPEALTESIEELPTRPPHRSFLKRIGTRLHLPQVDATQYKAVRMTRSAYNAHFRRDAARNYIGSESEREWTIEELEKEFGMYQDRRTSSR